MVSHTYVLNSIYKLKWSRYRPGVTQRVGRGIALLFHDRGTRRGWVVSSTPRPQFTPGKGPVPILQEAGWAPGPVWRGGASRPHLDSIPDHPARSQSLSGKCVIHVVCVKLGKLYVVKHNCGTWGVFNDYIMDNYMFRPVLAIFRLS